MHDETLDGIATKARALAHWTVPQLRRRRLARIAFYAPMIGAGLLGYLHAVLGA